MLATLPESPTRIQRELTLLLTLGELLMVAKGQGAPEVGEVYTRAHTLCHQVGEPPQRFQVLRGLYQFHGTRAQLPTAGELSQQLLHLAHHQHDTVLVLEGHMAVGSVALFRGDLVAARAHLEHSLRLCDTKHPPLSASGGYVDRVIILALLRRPSGRWAMPTRRSSGVQEALALAQQIGSIPPVWRMRQPLAALPRPVPPGRGGDAGTRRGGAWPCAAQRLAHRVAHGRLLRGWALAMQGDAAAGVAHIHQGLAAVQRHGLQAVPPLFSRLAGRGVWPGGAARGRAARCWPRP